MWLIGMSDKKKHNLEHSWPVSNIKKLRKVSFSTFRHYLQLSSMPKTLELAVFLASTTTTTTTTDGHDRSLYPCCACVRGNNNKSLFPGSTIRVEVNGGSYVYFVGVAIVGQFIFTTSRKNSSKSRYLYKAYNKQAHFTD